MRRILTLALIAVLLPLAVVAVVNLTSDNGEPEAALTRYRYCC
ncbi:hypothetical protein FHX40_1583 [Thermopolyspora flexuosa]|jgi:hypothetical protein|uniref:Uncharacterized protein n=1 Tax=Thermopolyspora flexuosa TaxID=103836 RepID=A0A543IWG8_9ACTN|nr:hypothetical protein FHX40_1583 [Thermopolyspora flexuosa]